jgi:hypothetical protein
MDGARRQRIAQTTLAENHVVNGRVFRQHRDDDLASGAELGQGRCDPSAAGRCLRGALGDDIVDDEIVAAFEDPRGHPRAHTPEADETDVH